MSNPPPNLKPNQTYLGFDFGTKRIGVAIGQTITFTAKPLGNVKATDGIPHWQTLEDYFKEWQPDGFVIGMPLNMDGSASEMSLRANKFANRLHGRFGKPSYNQDERLSTRDARDRLENDPRYEQWKKQPVDCLAAVIILEDWFSAHRE